MMSIIDLWHSSDPLIWEQALQRYWLYVQPRNIDLEKSLNTLDLERIRRLNAQGWYDFLHNEYFRWKYTAPNRYATTTSQLRKYIDGSKLDELDAVREQLLNLDLNEVRVGLRIAKKIRGLGTAGASGLLSLIYPQHFATVDQFVVKALRQIDDLPEAPAISRMNPLNLTLDDGVLLISILKRKAQDNNGRLGSSVWTPRMVDMVLWTYGR
jgi:hypothetical protein